MAFKRCEVDGNRGPAAAAEAAAGAGAEQEPGTVPAQPDWEGSGRT